VRAVVVGGDARAHVLAAVLGRSGDVVVSGGNPGMAALGIDITPAPPEELDGDLFVISPEAPLVDGVADRLRAQGKRVFGPGADGARLEGSKAWMKEVVAGAGVPTAAHGAFGDAAPAIAFLRTLPPPYVVKTDGLAAGKGVLVTDDLAAAEDDVRAKLSGAAFGAAGATVVVEEGMVGPELSVLVVCDGRDIVALPAARDFKRIGDDDTGPNTGGMGSFTPVPGIGADLVGDVLDRFVGPTLHALRARGIDYRGTLYTGLMLTAAGPKLVEYNVRFGDPEAQVVLPLVADLADLLAAAADGDLAGRRPSIAEGARVCVVAAAEGYPDAPVAGAAITGLDAVDPAAADVYSAGVGCAADGGLVVAGGRVLSVVGGGPTIAAARDNAYEQLARVSFAGMQVRHDIAAEAAQEETPT
jgi:phosphoribosylamine---glycine ligase